MLSTPILLESLCIGLQHEMQQPSQLVEHYAQLGKRTAAQHCVLLSQWQRQQIQLLAKTLHWLANPTLEQSPQPIQLDAYMWETFVSSLEGVWRHPLHIVEKTPYHCMLDQAVISPLLEQFIHESYSHHLKPCYHRIEQHDDGTIALYLLPPHQKELPDPASWHSPETLLVEQKQCFLQHYALSLTYAATMPGAEACHFSPNSKQALSLRLTLNNA